MLGPCSEASLLGYKLNFNYLGLQVNLPKIKLFVCHPDKSQDPELHWSLGAMQLKACNVHLSNCDARVLVYFVS